MKSLQEAYNSIYIQEEIIETIDVFECAYITLVENGMCEDDATEVVNYIYEHLDEIQELEQDLQEDLNENAAGRLGLTLLGGVAKLLNFLPKKKGVQRLLNMPKPKLPSQLPTMQSVVKKTPVPTGNPVQGRLLTKTGKAQNFTGGRTPFTGTDPVPAASSRLPQPAAPASQAPGQMRIPGMSDRAQELRNVTGNPNLGLPGNTQGFAVTGGSNATRNKGIFRAQQQRTAPSLPQPPASPARGVDLKKGAAVTGMTGLTAAAIDSVGQANKTSSERNAQRAQKLAQQEAETRAASQPVPEPTGERSAAANAERQEKAKAEAEATRRSRTQLTAAAKDFDKAFAAARASGKKEFTWRGRTYNTKMK